MSVVSLTGQDTIQIDGLNFAALADGNAFEITFPNELGTVKAGKNGNSMYAKNEAGRIGEVNVRVVLGSTEDKYLTAKLALWTNGDTASFPLMTAVLVKRVGDGAGNVESKIYQCSGGFFKNQPSGKTSAEGDVDQSVAVYMLRFGNVSTSIQ